VRAGMMKRGAMAARKFRELHETFRE